MSLERTCLPTETESRYKDIQDIRAVLKSSRTVRPSIRKKRPQTPGTIQGRRERSFANNLSPTQPPPPAPPLQKKKDPRAKHQAAEHSWEVCEAFGSWSRNTAQETRSRGAVVACPPPPPPPLPLSHPSLYINYLSGGGGTWRPGTGPQSKPQENGTQSWAFRVCGYAV